MTKFSLSMFRTRSSLSEAKYEPLSGERSESSCSKCGQPMRSADLESGRDCTRIAVYIIPAFVATLLLSTVIYFSRPDSAKIPEEQQALVQLVGESQFTTYPSVLDLSILCPT